MIPLNTVVPATAAVSGVVLAVTIALSVTAIAALSMVLVKVLRTRLNGVTAVVSAASVFVILVGAVFVGGALTHSPAAPADEDHAARPLAEPASSIELPTLSLPD